MLIIHQFLSIWLITTTELISSVPLCSDSSKLSLRETFDLFPPSTNEDTTGPLDFSLLETTHDAASLSSQTEPFALSAELGSCPAGGIERLDEATPLPPVNLELPDLLDVFGIGGEDEQSPDAINKGSFWDDENINPCRGRDPYRLHVCCEGELGTFDGAQMVSIDDCVIRMYCILVFFFTGFKRTGFHCGFCY